MASYTIIVPTKKHDGGSNVIRAFAAPHVDAFAKYSNTLLRMKHLMLFEDSDEDVEEEALNDALRLRQASIRCHGQCQCQCQNADNEEASKRRKGNDSSPIQQQGVLERKTRLSFELHPSLLFHDLMNRDVNGAAYISDEEDEDHEPHEQKGEMMWIQYDAFTTFKTYWEALIWVLLLFSDICIL